MDIQGKPKTGRPGKFSYRNGRKKGLFIRISEADLRKLDILCHFYGVTKTDFLINSIENGWLKMKEIERRNTENGRKKG